MKLFKYFYTLMIISSIQVGIASQDSSSLSQDLSSLSLEPQSFKQEENDQQYIQMSLINQDGPAQSPEFQLFKAKAKEIEKQALCAKDDPFELHKKCKAELEAIYQDLIKTASSKVALEIITEKGICDRNIFHFCRKKLEAQQKNNHKQFRKRSY